MECNYVATGLEDVSILLLTALFDNYAPWWQLDGCSVTKPFLSVKGVAARLQRTVEVFKTTIWQFLIRDSPWNSSKWEGGNGWVLPLYLDFTFVRHNAHLFTVGSTSWCTKAVSIASLICRPPPFYLNTFMCTIIHGSGDQQKTGKVWEHLSCE